MPGAAQQLPRARRDLEDPRPTARARTKLRTHAHSLSTDNAGRPISSSCIATFFRARRITRRARRPLRFPSISHLASRLAPRVTSCLARAARHVGGMPAPAAVSRRAGCHAHGAVPAALPAGSASSNAALPSLIQTRRRLFPHLLFRSPRRRSPAACEAAAARRPTSGHARRAFLPAAGRCVLRGALRARAHVKSPPAFFPPLRFAHPRALTSRARFGTRWRTPTARGTLW